IKNAKTCKEAWAMLKKDFLETSNSQKLVLKCQYHEAKQGDRESLSKYLDRVVYLEERLRELGVETKQQEVCYKILSSIRDEYRVITMSCMQLSEEKLTISYLRQQFALEESRSNFKGQKQQNFEAKALIAGKDKQHKKNKNKIS